MNDITLRLFGDGSLVISEADQRTISSWQEATGITLEIKLTKEGRDLTKDIIDREPEF